MDNKRHIFLALIFILWPLILIAACSHELEPSITTPLVINPRKTPAPPTMDPTLDTFLTEVAYNIATNVVATQRPTTTPSGLFPECGHVPPPIYYSPNGQWLFVFCNDLIISSQDKTRRWILSYDELYGREFNSGVGGISPEYWSIDGNTLYLTIGRGVSGPIYFANGWGILELNLQTGEISEILSLINYPHYSISFSTTGEFLAYITQIDSPLVFTIKNLNNSNIQTTWLEEQYNQAGSMIWSPDQTKIIFCQAIAGDIEGELFSLAILEIETMEIQTLIPNNEKFRCPKSWVEGDVVVLADYSGNEWLFDVLTESFIN